MNWKDYTVMVALAMATLTAVLCAVWDPQSPPNQPAKTHVGDVCALQTTNSHHIPASVPVRAENTEAQVIKPSSIPVAIPVRSTVSPAPSVVTLDDRESLIPAASACVSINATAAPVLPASLQKRFPSARTIEPVKLSSLADELELQAHSSEQLQRLKLPSPHGRTVDVIVRQHKRIHDRRGTISGSVAGFAQSEVIVSYCDDAITASVLIPGTEIMEIAYAGNGFHVLLDIDPSRILPNAPPVIPHQELAKASSP